MNGHKDFVVVFWRGAGAGGIHCQQTCSARNAKRSSSIRKKVIDVRNLDLHKEECQTKNKADGLN